MLYRNNDLIILVGKETYVIKDNKIIQKYETLPILPEEHFRIHHAYMGIICGNKYKYIDVNGSFCEKISKTAVAVGRYYIDNGHVYYKMAKSIKFGNYYRNNFKLKDIYYVDSRFCYYNGILYYYVDGTCGDRNLQYNNKCEKLEYHFMHRGNLLHDHIGHYNGYYFRTHYQHENYCIGNAKLFILLEMIMKFLVDVSTRTNMLGRTVIPRRVRYYIYEFVK